LITDSDTIHIDRSISGHDGTNITIRSDYSNRIFESNHILSLHLIVTSRLGIHTSDTERITLVKLMHALSISGSHVNEIDSAENTKLKTALSQTIFKQQRNRVNNLKKQLKEHFLY
jgi:hypothetical protein